MSDIDHLINVQQAGIVAVANAETEAGAPLGNITAFVRREHGWRVRFRTRVPSYAKPAVFPLHANVRGPTRRIDPTRYRILTAELGLPNKARDICGGSIVRVVWHVAGDASETYSDDIILNSRAGRERRQPPQHGHGDAADRARQPVADRLGAGRVTESRHHVVPDRSARVCQSDVILHQADEAGGARYGAHELQRAVDDEQDGRQRSTPTTMSTRIRRAKSLIGSANASALSAACPGIPPGLPDGAEYFVYVEHNDGENVNGAYSKWPVIIDHTPASNTRLVLNRSTLNFGVVAQTIKTPAQTLGCRSSTRRPGNHAGRRRPTCRSSSCRPLRGAAVRR